MLPLAERQIQHGQKWCIPQLNRSLLSKNATDLDTKYRTVCSVEEKGNDICWLWLDFILFLIISLIYIPSALA